MKWLTKTEIARRAKKSYKEALLVSIEHHQQISQSTRKEFFAAVGAGKVAISSDYCGVCQWIPSKKCEGCFLKATGYTSGCGNDWQRIQRAINDILTGRLGKSPSWATVIIAEKKMIVRLERELKRELKKQ